MADPRCTCAMPACPICSAPAHQPWQPKPGAGPASDMQAREIDKEAEILRHMIERHRQAAATLRRYLLVLLLALLGGMIGGVASALTILHYL